MIVITIIDYNSLKMNEIKNCLLFKIFSGFKNFFNPFDQTFATEGFMVICL